MRYELCAGAILLLLIALLPIVSSAQPPGKLPAPCSIGYPSDAALEWDCRTLRPKESLETLFGEYWIDVARFNRIDRRHVRAGVSIKIPRRIEDLAEFQPMPLFYSPAEQEEQSILVDLSEQPSDGEVVVGRPPLGGAGEDDLAVGLHRERAEDVDETRPSRLVGQRAQRAGDGVA